MSGWKTWLAVIGMSALGAARIMSGEAEEGIGLILGALGMLGIGHKVEKASK